MIYKTTVTANYFEEGKIIDSLTLDYNFNTVEEADSFMSYILKLNIRETHKNRVKYDSYTTQHGSYAYQTAIESLLRREDRELRRLI